MSQYDEGTFWRVAARQARIARWALGGALALSACASADAESVESNKTATPAVRKPEPRTAAHAPNAEATRVEVAVIDKSVAKLHVTIPGEVEGSRDALLASAQGGPIERVLVREGERVKKNQLLVQIDTALYQIRKRQAETQLARARRELERSQGLGTALPAAERERRRSEVELLESNLALASLQLDRSRIRAPFAGVVSEIHVEVGEAVAPAAPLLHLVRLDPVDVVLSVPDRDVVALKPGAEVTVRIAALPDALEGKIARINPTGDQETRAFRAEVEVDNPELTVLPGMIATVHIDRTLAEGAVVIPQDWLVTRRDGVGVFLEQDGIAHYAPVTAGSVVRDQVVIDSGLSAGARVVTTGHRALADSDPLVIAREGRCCVDGRVQFP